jgi:hypothetical protein
MSSRPAVLAATFAGFLGLALAPGAAPLAAQSAVETYRGSHCHPKHSSGETAEWEYVGADLVNRGVSSWDILIASCPIHASPTQSASNSRLAEIRVVVDGATYSNAWCRLTDWQGVRRTMRNSSTNPEWFTWQPAWNADIVGRDFTVECLLLPDWELERIEVVWFWGGNL